MIALSPKATVPVLKLLDDTVLEESLDIMHWALGENDPENWLDPEVGTSAEVKELIAESDGPFKHNIDRYKYAIRYEEGTDPVFHRTEGAAFLEKLNGRLGKHTHLFGDRPCLADFAIFPFVRQFANTDRAWVRCTAPTPFTRLACRSSGIRTLQKHYDEMASLGDRR